MSSFITSDKTVNIIATFILDECKFDHRFLKRVLNNRLEEIFGKDWDSLKEKNEGLEKLVLELRKMNIKAMNERYENFSLSSDLLPSPSYESTNIYQIIKSLDCFCYQCCEGDIPQSKLYKLLERTSTSLCKQLIRESEQYRNEKWDA